MPAASRSEPAFEGHVLDLDVHSRALVEPCRARGVLRVDPQRGPGQPAPAELVKRVTQEREPEASPTPGLAHAEHADEAAAAAARVAAGVRRDLSAVRDGE